MLDEKLIKNAGAFAILTKKCCDYAGLEINLENISYMSDMIFALMQMDLAMKMAHNPPKEDLDLPEIGDEDDYY